MRRMCFNTTEPKYLYTMKAVTLITIIVSAAVLSSCCCQSQSMPPLRPMPKDLATDTQVPVEPIKVLDQKAK